MLVRETEFLLKDGRKALIRSPKEEDVQSMIEYLYKSAEESDFLLRYPEECSIYTEEAEKKFIDDINNSTNKAMFVCLVDGRVAGNLGIDFGTRIKTKHRAHFGIALIKEFWGQGIGTRLMEEMINFVGEHPNILQIELEFIEGNNRARALYEKMGFRITGLKPNAIRLKDGTLLNEYFMVREMGW